MSRNVNCAWTQSCQQWLNVTGGTFSFWRQKRVFVFTQHKWENYPICPQSSSYTRDLSCSQKKACKIKFNAGSTVTSCSFCTACALHVLQAAKASGSFNGHRVTWSQGVAGNWGASKDERVGISMKWQAKQTRSFFQLILYFLLNKWFKK